MKQEQFRLKKSQNHLMKRLLNSLLLLALVCTSCNETIPVGTDILPIDDITQSFFNDTTTIIGSTVREDSLRSDRLQLSQLGYMDDPIFGKTKATILTSFRAPNGTVSPAISDDDGGYTLDSVVLNLAISAIYGDSTQPMSFKVYKQTEILNNQQIYFSNFNFSESMTEVGSISNFIPKLSSQYAEGENDSLLGPQLRIKLAPFFGQSLINILGTDIIRSDEQLLQILPGLVIVPEMQPGSIVEMNMIASTTEIRLAEVLRDSRLSLYFKDGDGENQRIIFPATVSDLGINQYSHDYDGTNIETALNANEPEGETISYIQGLAGTKVKVELPHLSAYENIAVNKAELVVTQVKDGAEDILTAPDRVFALLIDEDGNDSNISDLSAFSASAHVGGRAIETTLSDGSTAFQYRINITDQLKRLIAGDDENYGLYLSTYSDQDETLVGANLSNLFPTRMVIGGSANSSEEIRLKLDLTYSIFE